MMQIERRRNAKTRTRIVFAMVLSLSLIAGVPGLLAAHAAPDFSLTAPGSINCVQGARGCGYTVTVTSLNGFTGNVNLSITFHPAGTTTTISPTTVTLSSGGQATATVSIKPPSSGSVTVEGTGGGNTHDVTTHLILVT